jgi:hypothetical protein
MEEGNINLQALLRMECPLDALECYEKAREFCSERLEIIPDQAEEKQALQTDLGKAIHVPF